MKFKLVLLGGGFLALLLFAYSLCVEPVWLRVRAIPVPVSSEKGRTLRIVHLTDLHWGGSVSREYLRRSLSRAAAQHPDLIVITGDFMGRKVRDPEAYSEALRKLSRAAPTFAVGGNHDGGSWAYRVGGYATTDSLRAIIQAANITYLENEYACPSIKGLRVCIGGMGDIWAGLAVPDAFRDRYDSENADLKIMLTHNPDSKALVAKDDWDLLLAGHSHGGQVVMPLIGAPWAPVRDKTRLRGLSRYEGRWMHVSPGVGSSGHRVRFNCRPEISVLEVRL
jgi:hypothetical protein